MKSKNLVVTFDQDARREYLTGFQKRKRQRQQKFEKIKKDQAKEDLRHARRVRHEQRRELLKAYEQAGEDQENVEESTEYNEGKVTVTVSELVL